MSAAALALPALALPVIDHVDVSIRELKARPAQAIAYAQRGIRVNITSHKKTVAHLVSTSANTSGEDSRHEDVVSKEGMTNAQWIARAVAQMRAAGMTVRAGVGSGPVGAAIEFEPLPDGRTMADLISEGRGPR